MKTIPLFGCSEVAIVDDGDFAALSRYKWHKHSAGYAARGQWNKETKKTDSILMHRQIISAPKRKSVDHIDFNKLNNTRSNLRSCSWSQNIAHSGPRKNRFSKFKGVCWRQNIGKWYAYVSKNRRQISAGCHASETDAAKAYNSAAITHFGEFAYLNPIP